MRLTLILALTLNACAHSVAPASSPATAASSQPADCLDMQGQRELLAGIWIAGGEQAGQLARCKVQRGAAISFGDQQASRAQAAEQRLVWALPVTGVAAATVAAVVTAVIMSLSHHEPAVAK